MQHRKEDGGRFLSTRYCAKHFAESLILAALWASSSFKKNVFYDVYIVDEDGKGRGLGESG